MSIYDILISVEVGVIMAKKKKETAEKEVKNTKQNNTTKKQVNKKQTKSTSKSQTKKVSKKTEKKVEVEAVVEEKYQNKFINASSDEEAPNNEKVEVLEETPIDEIEEKTEKIYEVEIETDLNENTQVIRIREALKPIHKQKKIRLSKKYKDVDYDFADITKDNNFGKFILILGIIVLFVLLLPTIARTINKNFILDNEYEPYVPEKKEQEEKKEEKKEPEPMNEIEALDFLKSHSLEFLGLETPIDELLVEFENNPIEINAINSYVINLYQIVEDERTYLTSFAVALDKSVIFTIGEDGRYQKIEETIEEEEE